MFFIIVLITVLFITGKAARQARLNSLTPTCKQHQWVYDETGFLICDRCKNRPGYQGRDDG